MCRRANFPTKSIRIWKLPGCLVVHFQRFDRNTRKKDCTTVDFPLDNFELVDGENKLHTYQLVSCCNHTGMIDYGHYTAVCRTLKGWK